MLAQRYPEAYDGISVGAPVLYLTLTGTSLYWPQEVMKVLDQYPYNCEMDAITAAATKKCDKLDGVVDGIVADIDGCVAAFDPFTMVGKKVKNCAQAGNKTVEIGLAAAVVVNATWQGMVTPDGKPLWYGLSPGTLISAEGDGMLTLTGTAATNCSSGTCVGMPSDLTVSWIDMFVAKGDPEFDLDKVGYEEYYDIVKYGQQVYRSTLDTDDPDLSKFQKAGGKIVSFHGLVSFVFFLPFRGVRGIEWTCR